MWTGISSNDCLLFSERIQKVSMSSDEDKPPAPPVRLTSNRATDRGDSVASVDMRPLPKGMSKNDISLVNQLIHQSTLIL